MGRSLEYQLEPLRDGQGTVVGVIGVGFDVTERELAKEEQVKLAAQLRQAQKLEAIGRLAGGVAHDFNNLLTCMLGNLALAENQLDPESPLRRHLGIATSAAESAATLTRQLLAFGRKQVIEPRPVSLSLLIERVRGSETILLVEDEPLVLELAELALQELGYRVLACAGADEALRASSDHPHPIDLLVTDVMMPRMNGRELAARVLSLRPGTAVLFTSGYGEDIIARQGVLDSGLHFIEKPYRPSDLSVKVREILDQRAQESRRTGDARLPRAM
jgi:CheY-like chemotaxis protein